MRTDLKVSRKALAVDAAGLPIGLSIFSTAPSPLIDDG